MAKVETRCWDAVEHLDTKEDRAAYLEAALEDGYLPLVAAVLEDIARVQGLTSLDQFSVLSVEVRLDFSEVLRAVEVLGLRSSAVDRYSSFHKHEVC
ncbi:MAG: transcriptional regulator [Cyanobacteria bacterium P01_G01_bin.54]